MLESYDFFPTQVFRYELPGWIDHVDEVTGEYYRESGKDNSPVIQTRDLTNNKSLLLVHDFFLEQAKKILLKQGYALENYKFFVKDLWAQLFNSGGFNLPHLHPNSQISGLYFFNVPDDDNSLSVFIKDPRPAKISIDLAQRVDNLYPATALIRINTPKKGTFLLFNSWLEHYVMVDKTNQPVKFLHFNLGCNFNEGTV